MKAIKYLSIAAASLILASCAKEELIPDNESVPAGPTTVTFVSSCETKTSLDSDLKTTKWDEAENVLLWEGETALTISNKSYDSGILTITADVKNTGSTFYSVIGPKDNDNVTRTSATVLATQNPAKASFDPNAEILVAQPATCGEGNTVALRYNRPVAITVATLKDLEEGEKVQSVKITANKPLTGNVNFTYVGTNVNAEMDKNGGNTIICEYTTNNTVVQGTEGEGYIFPVYFISLNADVTVFEFEVCTDQHKYYRKITRPEDSPIVLNDNRVATFGFKLENADKADAEGDKFVKVTAAPTDWSGEYLLVYEDNTTAYCWTGVDAADCNTTATIADGAIASQPDGAVTITIASMEEGYSVLVNGGTNNGKYIFGTSGKNEIKFGTTASANTLSYDSESNSVLMTSNTSVMRYNSASSDNRFRYFKSSSYTSQKAVQLYKKTLGGYGLFTLHTPTNIQYDSENNKITWDAVENAGRYTISLNGGEPIECEINEYSTSELTAEYYYASVIALPSAETEDTYKQSEAGSHEGWFKIGEPKMPKLDANNITLNITKSTITASWENDPSAQNGYIAEIWSRTKNDKDEDVDDELLKTEDVTEGTVTFTELTDGTKYHIKVTTKAADITDDRGTRAYINSDPANKYPQTSSVYTIAEILALSENTVTCQVENAVIYAKGENCYLVNDGTGYIMVNASAGDYAVGDKLTISGKTESYNSQKRFDNTTTIIEKTVPVTPVYPDVASYDGEFTYAKYVNIVGKTSKSGSVVSIADAAEHSLKLIDNAGLEGDQYVTVTGYLTHKTDAGYINMIVVEKHINTISVTENGGHEWDNNSLSEKTFTISTDDDAEWTYESNNTTDWTVTKPNNTLSVRPNAINTSTTSSKSLTITLTHSDNTMLTTTIQCSQNPKPVVYEKYTEHLTEGYYLITFDNGAMKNTVTSNRFDYTEISPVNGKVSAPAVDIVWKIEKSGDYWTIYNETVKKYAASNGTKNQGALIDSGTDDKSQWTISKNDDGTFDFVNKYNNSSSVNAYLQRNGSNGFACYAKGYAGSLTLYKLEDSRTPQSLTFAPEEGSYDLYTQTGTTPTLSGAQTTVTYTSSNTSVADVDFSTGVITAHAVGYTTITATAEATTVYRGATASYVLTVTDTTPRTDLDAPTNLSWTESNKTLSWTDPNTAKGTYNTNYKYQYSVNGGTTWLDATTSTTAVLSITSTTTVKVKAVAITTAAHNSSSEASKECTITPTEKTYSFEINTSNFTKPTGTGSSYDAYSGAHTYTAVCTTDANITLEVTIQSSDVMIQSSKIQGKKSSGVLWNTTDLGVISKVEVTDNSNFTVYKNTTVKPTSNATSGSCNYFSLKAGSSASTCTKIVVTFTK